MKNFIKLNIVLFFVVALLWMPLTAQAAGFHRLPLYGQ